MSRIYFTSEGGAAEIRGSERAHMGITIGNLSAAAFSPGTFSPDLLYEITGFDKARYAGFGGGLEFTRDFVSFVGGSGDREFLIGERRVSVFLTTLNTVLAIGNDPLRMFTRLHGQCEIHAWVDGRNRAWLADIIDAGRTLHICRPNQGWEAVSTFLRETDAQPVVTSYSVTDGFPNSYVAGIRNDEQKREAWYDLTDAEKWAQCMAALRTNEGEYTGLEIRPDDWAYPDFYFGDGDTAFSILARTAPPGVDPSSVVTAL